jgi:predicted RNA-binding protein with PIN domain
MSLHYIIDGYNIIKHNIFPRKASLHDSRKALMNFIEDKKLAGSAKNKVTIVFDGSTEVLAQKSTHRYEIIFTKNESADSKIKKLVSNAKNPKEIVVVSDDREIAFFIRAAGAKPLSVNEFMGKNEETFKKDRIEPVERKLTYTEMSKINEELKKIWLK